MGARVQEPGRRNVIPSWLRWLGASLALAVALLALVTAVQLQPLPERLPPALEAPRKAQLLDRHGQPLTVTYQNQWNLHDRLPLHEIPDFLRQAFITAEDRRFAEHAGVDWRARLAALMQNIKAGRTQRGASTLSEQAVRMLHPRPRTLWSRWLEGFEATALERRFDKRQILEFYLNQVPYGGQRRGVRQAARYYFDRDLSTLSRREMLALAVLVRAPSRLDPHRDAAPLERRIDLLAEALAERGELGSAELEAIARQALAPRRPALEVAAPYFAQRVYGALPPGFAVRLRLRTTLDSALQAKAQAILDRRREALAERGVRQAALIVIEHASGEVLAYVGSHDGGPGSAFDPAAVPRQPGSALKPFVYALALEEGWTAATLIDDSPLTEAVGRGLHSYHNFSRSHYGPVRLREALGNSLNIPAVRAAQFVGPQRLLSRLQRLGIASLSRHPDHYGDGLALGNGEISLWELAGAFAALARGGDYLPPRLLLDAPPAVAEPVFSPEVSGLIADILSDPGAREREFGQAGLMRFPVQTAVKTGTSNDYRDAWVVGFDRRYTAAVWMGSLDGRPMRELTGAQGPLLALRSLFAELNRDGGTGPLPLSPRLITHEICADDGRPAESGCVRRREYFLPGTAPVEAAESAAPARGLRLRQPSWDLRLALDPRIPDERERFAFVIEGLPQGASVEWFLNEEPLAQGSSAEYLWPLRRGEHRVWARVSTPGGTVEETARVPFQVR